MAYIVGKSAFNPFSFQELLVPLQIYSQEYKETEDLLDKTSDLRFTDALTPGSQAATMYQTAENNLRGLSDELATQGLSSGLRSRLKSAARDYKQTMGQLTTAQTKFNDEINRRLKLGEDYVYQDSNLTLDNFLEGKTVSPNQINLKQLTSTLGTELGAIANNVMGAPEWSKIKESSNQYYQIAQEYGYDNADIMYVMSGSFEYDPSLSDSQKEDIRNRVKPLQEAIKNKKQAIGYSKYTNINDRDRIDAAINEALYGALGSTKYSYQSNTYGSATYQHQVASERAKVNQLRINNPWLDIDDYGNVLGIKEGWKQDTTTGVWKDPEGNIMSKSIIKGTQSNGTEYTYKITKPIRITIKPGSRKHGQTSVIEDAINIKGKLKSYDELNSHQKEQVDISLNGTHPNSNMYLDDGGDVIIVPKEEKRKIDGNNINKDNIDKDNFEPNIL